MSKSAPFNLGMSYRMTGSAGGSRKLTISLPTQGTGVDIAEEALICLLCKHAKQTAKDPCGAVLSPHFQVILEMIFMAAFCKM